MRFVLSERYVAWLVFTAPLWALTICLMEGEWSFAAWLTYAVSFAVAGALLGLFSYPLVRGFRRWRDS